MRIALISSLALGIGCAGPRAIEPSPAPRTDAGAIPDTAVAESDSVEAASGPLTSSDRMMAILRGLRASRRRVHCPMPVAVPVQGATARMPVVGGAGIAKMPVAPVDCVNPLFRRPPTVRHLPRDRQ